jgi:hypothetical protein
MRTTEFESKRPGEFISALEFLPDEWWPISIIIGVVIAVVFSLIWLLGAVFRSFFGE